MYTRAVLLVLLCLLVASCAAAQDPARPHADLNQIDYSRYGFDVDLPPGAVRVGTPIQTPDGTVDVYVCSGLAVAIGIAKPPAGKTVASAMEEAVSKMELGTTSFSGQQGVIFKGGVGSVALTKEMASGLPGLPLRPGMMVRMSLYMTPLPRDPGRVLAAYFGGPADKAAAVDSLAQTVLSSINFTGSKPGQNTAAAEQSGGSELALTSGQIALRGKVVSVKPDSKSLTMLADEVTAYGQKPVALNPARQKVVTFAELPGDIRAGVRVLVIGRNAGTGKPMPAISINVEAPAAPSK